MIFRCLAFFRRGPFPARAFFRTLPINRIPLGGKRFPASGIRLLIPVAILLSGKPRDCH